VELKWVVEFIFELSKLGDQGKQKIKQTLWKDIINSCISVPMQKYKWRKIDQHHWQEDVLQASTDSWINSQRLVINEEVFGKFGWRADQRWDELREQRGY